MSLIEAQDLLDLIKYEMSKISANLRCLGNGEWVVIVNNMFIWRLKDWDDIKGKV